MSRLYHIAQQYFIWKLLFVIEIQCTLSFIRNQTIKPLNISFK